MARGRPKKAATTQQPSGETMNPTLTDIIAHVKSNTPIFWIKTTEEGRLIREVLEGMNCGTSQGFVFELVENKKAEINVWSLTQGNIRISPTETTLASLPTATPDDATQDLHQFLRDLIARTDFGEKENVLVFLRGAHKILGLDPAVVRKICDIRTAFYGVENNTSSTTSHTKITLFLLGNSNEIPEELSNLVKFYDYPYMTKEEIQHTIKNNLKLWENAPNISEENGAKFTPEKERITYSDEELQGISSAMAGLTLPEILDVFNFTLTEHKEMTVPHILESKNEVLARSDILELETNLCTMDDVGGLDAIKDWLRFKELANHRFGRSVGIEIPNGVLLLGVQGGGKSLIGRVMADYFSVPLVRLDVGRVFAGLVGASESRMRDMIKQVESLKKAVLFIDEIEKGFSGTGSSNNSDSGTTSRIFATMITWLNDKRTPGHPGHEIMVVGTANTIKDLPPEFLRKGRFDEIWFFDVPTPEEAADIFRIHVRRQNLPIIGEIDYSLLGSVTYEKSGRQFNYTGAEIEQACVESRSEAVSRLFPTLNSIKKDEACASFGITTGDIHSALKKIVPLSVTMEEQIKDLRKFGQTRCRPASTRAAADKSRLITTEDTKGLAI